MLLFTVVAFAQEDYLLLSDGETVTELYKFNGNNALWLTVPTTFDGDSITFLISAYESLDSLKELFDFDQVSVLKKAVVPGRTYTFYPPETFALQYFGAIKSNTAASGSELFRIRPGIYAKSK